MRKGDVKRAFREKLRPFLREVAAIAGRPITDTGNVTTYGESSSASKRFKMRSSMPSPRSAPLERDEVKQALVAALKPLESHLEKGRPEAPFMLPNEKKE